MDIMDVATTRQARTMFDGSSRLVRTEPITQLIEKPIMRVCINDLERARKLGVSVTLGEHSATIAKEQHRSDSAALVPCSLRLEPTRRNNHSMNHSVTHSATTAKEHHRSGVGKRSQAAVVAKQMLWLLLNISATELTAQLDTESTAQPAQPMELAELHLKGPSLYFFLLSPFDRPECCRWRLDNLKSWKLGKIALEPKARTMSARLGARSFQRKRKTAD